MRRARAAPRAVRASERAGCAGGLHQLSALVALRTRARADSACALTPTRAPGHQTRPAPAEKAGTAANDKLALAQQLAAKLASGGVTHVVLLEGLVDAATIRIDDERQEVRGPPGCPSINGDPGVVAALTLRERGARCEAVACAQLCAQSHPHLPRNRHNPRLPGV